MFFIFFILYEFPKLIFISINKDFSFLYNIYKLFINLWFLLILGGQPPARRSAPTPSDHIAHLITIKLWLKLIFFSLTAKFYNRMTKYSDEFWNIIIKKTIIILFSKFISIKNFLISHLNANTNYSHLVLRTAGQTFCISKNNFCCPDEILQ